MTVLGPLVVSLVASVLDDAQKIILTTGNRIRKSDGERLNDGIEAVDECLDLLLCLEGLQESLTFLDDAYRGALLRLGCALTERAEILNISSDVIGRDVRRQEVVVNLGLGSETNFQGLITLDVEFILFRVA